MALLSLKIALEAFFSTYQGIKYRLDLFELKREYDLEDDVIDSKYTSFYMENSAEAIIHFHQFVELVCKEILRDENPLLVDNSRNHRK